MQYIERTFGAYTISDDPRRLQFDDVFALLRPKRGFSLISRASLQTAVEHSVCLGAYGAEGNQVGILRAVTDFASICYLGDLYVHEDHRFQGLSKALLAVAVNHPRLIDIPYWTLTTRDAHELFAQVGFSAVAESMTHMERVVSCEPGDAHGEDYNVCLGYD